MSKLIRILSIDGGGIRGVLPGQILVNLEQKLQEKSGDPQARISDFFDFFAGTSTGGILTLILLCPGENGRPRFSAKQAVDLYLEKGGDIFSRSLFHKIQTLGGVSEEKYSANSIEKHLDAYFKNIKLSEVIKPCLIPAYETQRRYAHFFTQHDAKHKPGYDFYIKDVARATSAAPTYFEAASIASTTGVTYSLVDGGVFANNPALCAFSEVSELFRTDGDLVTVDEMLMLSLGTGTVKKAYPYEKVKDWGAVGWIKPVIDIMMSGVSETVEFQMNQMFRSMGTKENYIRINPGLEGASSDMDNASEQNLKALKEAGQYCAEKNNALLDDLAAKLVEIGKKLSIT